MGMFIVWLLRVHVQLCGVPFMVNKHAVVVLRTRASDALQYLTGLALRSFLTASAFPFLRAIVCADAVEVEEEEAEAPPEEEEENEG